MCFKVLDYVYWGISESLSISTLGPVMLLGWGGVIHNSISYMYHDATHAVRYQKQFKVCLQSTFKDMI